MDNTKADRDNFRLIRINDGHKETVVRFHADTWRDAYSYLKAYVKKNKPDYTTYWDYANMYVDSKGNHFDDMFDMLGVSLEEHDRRTEKKNKYTFEFMMTLKRGNETVKTKMFRKTFVKPQYSNEKRDMSLVFKDFKFLVDNYDVDSSSTHNRSEAWSIDDHVMKDIMFNAERLKRNHFGYPTYCGERAKKHIENAKKYSSADVPDKLTNENDLAMKIWDSELDEMIRLVKTYLFYNSYGMDYANELPDLKVPVLPGSYDCIDYKKNSVLTQKAWKAWIRKFEAIGQNMWD